ncbi:hypothetical protein Slin15195_G127650 [Septoria linicola]|uniref:Uncharacterized protein n=1 Tax=Septoria linicola TaxID=215465 RepID=A0A9Q9EQ46_9PEZI|nr:hypothetical protein Slin15195_G127650 [Septoria linicola]
MPNIFKKYVYKLIGRTTQSKRDRLLAEISSTTDDAIVRDFMYEANIPDGFPEDNKDIPTSWLAGFKLLFSIAGGSVTLARDLISQAVGQRTGGVFGKAIAKDLVQAAILESKFKGYEVGVLVGGEDEVEDVDIDFDQREDYRRIRGMR